MTDDEIIAVVMAHQEGKKIQVRDKRDHPNNKWTNDPDPKWDFLVGEYRVAPEPRKPREWIVGVTPDRHIISWRPDLMPHEVTETIQVREVIE